MKDQWQQITIRGNGKGIPNQVYHMPHYVMVERELTSEEIEVLERDEFKGIGKWLIITLIIMALLAFPLTWVCNAFAQDDQKQPVMACANLDDWTGEITFYKWDGLVQFDAKPATIDRATLLEWEAVEVDYYATFEPLKYSKSFRFEAVINFVGTDAHLWVVSNGDDFWAWPFASYELRNDGNAHPCAAYQIESYEHQLLFGALVE